MRGARRSLAAAAAVLLLAGCGATTGGLFAKPLDGVRLMVPTPPGGGYDTTARTLAATATEAGLATEIEVFNLSGGAGVSALSRLMYEGDNDGRLVLQMGLGLVAGARVHGATPPITEAAPLARLIEEPEAILVPADSPYATFEDVLSEWTDPSHQVTVGGGSSPGGPDHLATMLLAAEIGEDPQETDYVWHDGGGELLAATLGHDVDIATAGASEYRHAIEAGELRVLAVTGPERIDGIDAPTLHEVGVDLEFTNWRGLLAPPGTSQAERDNLISALDKLHATPQWRAAIRDNYWSDAYLTGDEFGVFLTREDQRIDGVLDPLGLG
ncbi:putative tricarboxylic transport membrane protein [Lipingzhangella halophila]|uniref:Putative tricarboxylic transport membrane protein n=1 Tax=Lipingzhangella halophila TaxID=1783352 RepID=A0A7W7W4H9_9ACTN|nr:tripartite tricarboxylate transporter substrate-binding protein [Lipingzhangella halophila]MBB4933826.1 putative tricarboxylic transport membrane protein [Lipingzhangella halophila]